MYLPSPIQAPDPVSAANINYLDLAVARFLEATASARKGLALQGIQRKLERGLQRAFRLQGRQFLNRLAALKYRFPPEVREATAPDWEPLFDQAELASLEAFQNPLTDAVGEALLAGARETLGGAGMEWAFNLDNPRARAYLQAHGAELVRNINATTRGYLHTVVNEAMEKGWGYDKTAGAIRERYKEFAIGKPQKHIRSRAHLIAVTESGNAYEEGNRIPIQELEERGLEMEKQWQTVGDDRVSDGCAANEAEGWIPAGEPHLSGHMNPLRFPSCRCTELYRRKGTE